MFRATTALGCAILSGAVALPAQVADRAQGAHLRELANAARDADLRADWNGMVAAHYRLGQLPRTDASEAWIQYYQGYIDWRQSALAYIGEGAGGTTMLLREALEHLQRAREADPGMVEATALLALVETWSAFNMPPRAAELRQASLEHAKAAVSAAPGNPRVRLMQVILAFSPAAPRSTQDSLITEWRGVLAAFPSRPGPDAPVWGAAEGWGLLGMFLLGTGRYDEAASALEQAITLRPDFWWAREIALPQARQRPVRND